ncbi:MAG: L-histidine N(alpha)-methyltransferase [Flavobacteriia bacterium]|nr:L-histidine N(alpha)-methyltransferase [Flavobacteriia bacterium]
MSTITELSKIAKDVRDGLTSTPRTLPSKYFYDDAGDKLFQSIMAMPEYYLTDCEFEIFQTQADKILDAIAPHKRPFNLIELGAGDGSKTRVLLRHFQEKGVDFTYCPVDISANILNELKEEVLKELPDLNIELLAGDYFELLNQKIGKFEGRNVFLFLGSTIGNYNEERATRFLQKLRDGMREDDQLLMGVDLKKDPSVILKAYNDPHGITKEFNINLLRRLNEEIGANFDERYWMHHPTYDPQTGEARSYLVSTKPQEVYIEALDATYSFEAWEEVHTEISKKYSLKQLETLAVKAGFKMTDNFLDCKHYFVDTLWRPHND